jgi:hypothetical protein
MTTTTYSKPTHNRTRVAQVTMTVKRGLVAALLAAGLMVMPAAAQASALHTVCASGCNFTLIQDAVNSSNPDDLIEVMPGTYDEQVDVTVRLHISGAIAVPRPVIRATDNGVATVTIEPGAAGTTLSDLDIRGVGSNTTALAANGAVTASDLDLTATSYCAILNGTQTSQLGPGVTATSSGTECVSAGGHAADTVTGVTVNAPGAIGVSLSRGATLTDSSVSGRRAAVISEGIVRRATLHGTDLGVTFGSINGPNTPLVSDSVVTATGDEGIAVMATSNNMFDVPVRLRNVTAMASGKDSIGLWAWRQFNVGLPAGAIDARNVIARGTAHDVFAQPGDSAGCGGGGCLPGRVVIGYSNFRDAAGVLDTTIGHNQSADPLLVNPAAGAGQDLHIASADSPLIGAGTFDASDGPSDRDGVAHPDPPAIGAYEYTGPPAAPSGILPPGGGGGSAPAGPGGGNVTTSAGGGRRKPTISQLAETDTVFAVAPTSTPLRGRTAAASRKRGRTFVFGLDQPATVTIVIATSASCGRSTRRMIRCARTVATLTRSAHAGFNKLAFSGRIRGKPLKPGDYRAVFAATSAGGSSAPEVLRFRIVGP